MPDKLCQYHDCWCPGALCRQDIKSHGIDRARREDHWLSRIAYFTSQLQGFAHMLADMERETETACTRKQILPTNRQAIIWTNDG